MRKTYPAGSRMCLSQTPQRSAVLVADGVMARPRSADTCGWAYHVLNRSVWRNAPRFTFRLVLLFVCLPIQPQLIAPRFASPKLGPSTMDVTPVSNSVHEPLNRQSTLSELGGLSGSLPLGVPGHVGARSQSASQQQEVTPIHRQPSTK